LENDHFEREHNKREEKQIKMTFFRQFLSYEGTSTLYFLNGNLHQLSFMGKLNQQLKQLK